MGNCFTCLRSLCPWADSDSRTALAPNHSSSPGAQTRPSLVNAQRLLYQTSPSSQPEVFPDGKAVSADPVVPDQPPVSIITQVDGRPYAFSKLGAMEQATVVAAKPTGSSLKGSAFAIEDCTNTIVLLLDWSSQITVDLCKGCLVFIAPCDGSVFIRDCTECTIFVIGRQVRFRDCANCTVFIHCATPPALETSTGMTFCVFQGWYERLEEHFHSANLHVFDNQWARVYDFSPPADPASPNYRLSPHELWAAASVHLPANMSADAMAKLHTIPILSGWTLSVVSVPLTRPVRPPSSGVGSARVVAVVPAEEAHLYAQLAKMDCIDCRVLKDSGTLLTLLSLRTDDHMVAFLCVSTTAVEVDGKQRWTMVDLARDPELPAVLALSALFSPKES